MKKQKEKTKIHDLIFKEILKRGYYLEGNTRIWNIADSKLWYITPEQAQLYLDLEKSKDSQQIIEEHEAVLIDQNIGQIIKMLDKGSINVIDLGCGDGKKGSKIVKILKKDRKVKYCPIDISGYMVKKAIETFAKEGISEDVVEFKYNISDFENLENLTPLLRSNEFKQSLFLLFGNTLGNFELTELLYELRNAMVDKDVLVIGTGVYNQKWFDLVKTFNDDQNLKDFFISIPLLLGLEKEDVKFGVRFQHLRVEFYYTILKDKIVSYQDKELRFNEGDQIVVGFGYKHKKEDLLSIFKMYFSDVRVFISVDKTQALFLCKK